MQMPLESVRRVLLHLVRRELGMPIEKEGVLNLVSLAEEVRDLREVLHRAVAMVRVLKLQVTEVLGQSVKVEGKGRDRWDLVAVVHALLVAETGVAVSPSTTHLQRF